MFRAMAPCIALTHALPLQCFILAQACFHEITQWFATCGAL